MKKLPVDPKVKNEDLANYIFEQMIVKCWGWSKPYIDRRREVGFSKAYTQLEWLVTKWTVPIFYRDIKWFFK